MEKTITFEQLPTAVNQLSEKLKSIERLLLEKQVQQTKETHDQLLTIDEVAELLHLKKPTIYSNRSKGKIPGVCKRNKRLYFQKQVIIDWIKEGRIKSNSEIEADATTYLKKKGSYNDK